MLNAKKLYIVNLINSLLPATRLFRFKSKMYRWTGVNTGSNVRICSGVKILGCGELTIGNNVFLGHDSKILMAGGEVVIGENVDISSNVTIINGSHIKYDLSGRAAGTGTFDNIYIGNGVWLGVGVTVLGGSRIMPMSIIGACALVNTKLEHEGVYAGVPIKRID